MRATVIASNVDIGSSAHGVIEQTMRTPRSDLLKRCSFPANLLCGGKSCQQGSLSSLLAPLPDLTHISL